MKHWSTYLVTPPPVGSVVVLAPPQDKVQALYGVTIVENIDDKEPYEGTWMQVLGDIQLEKCYIVAIHEPEQNNEQD